MDRTDNVPLTVARTVIVVALCTLLNVLGSILVKKTGLLLYLDSIGTIITAALCGVFPGIVVGLATNLFKSFSDPSAVYYACVNVLIALITAVFAEKGYFKSVGKIIKTALFMTLVSGVFSAVLVWYIYGFAGEGITSEAVQKLYATGRVSKFGAQFLTDIFVDLCDKIISVPVAAFVIWLIPDSITDRMWLHGWKQNPLSTDEMRRIWHLKLRSTSLRVKIMLLVTASMLFLAVAAIAISTGLFREHSIDDHENLGYAAARLAASEVDPDRVDEFIRNGRSGGDYAGTEDALRLIKDCHRDIEYLYLYRIDEEGSHVVFEIGPDGKEGNEPGTVLPLEEELKPYRNRLIRGEEIEPVITNGSYGRLLSVYYPMRDSLGNYVCYAAADISMDRIDAFSRHFLVKMIALFTGFFFLVLAITIWFSEYHLILPLNSISEAASASVKNEEERKNSVERIRNIGIRTGDEIEELYHAFSQTTADCVSYVDEISDQSRKLATAQEGLIQVLAEVVESRDKLTGEHIKKTAQYVELILKQMKKDGEYPEILTDDYIQSVISSAPLHDVGKIRIPDAILNKTGKLTDEEYRIMQSHTIEGNEIIEQAIRVVPDPMYLKETGNIAKYHHENWDGTGYPFGLKGEEIPLSARIMAVADVFDALVSRRSYKSGFSAGKAFDLIAEGAGTHFDPVVVKEFLKQKEEAERIAGE